MCLISRPVERRLVSGDSISSRILRSSRLCDYNLVKTLEPYSTIVYIYIKIPEFFTSRRYDKYYYDIQIYSHFCLLQISLGFLTYNLIFYEISEQFLVKYYILFYKFLKLINCLNITFIFKNIKIVQASIKMPKQKGRQKQRLPYKQRVEQEPQQQHINKPSKHYNRQLVEQKINQLCIVQIAKTQKKMQLTYILQRKIIAGIIILLIASFIAYASKDGQKFSSVQDRIVSLQVEMTKLRRENEYLQKILNEGRDEVNNLHRFCQQLGHKNDLVYKKIKKIQETNYSLVIQKNVQDSFTEYSTSISRQVKQIIDKYKSQISKINHFTQKLAEEITQLNINQLSKEVKGYPIIIKHSDPFQFIINKNYIKNGYRQHYRTKLLNPLTIEKKSEQNKENIIIYTESPFQKHKNSYFELKIEKTDLGHISIGVISDEKLSKLDCGYCEAQTMYYMYANDAKIYHGNIFKYLTSSSYSKFKSILQKDIVTLLYDYEWQQVVWYINEKYAGHISISREDQHKNLYPFIIMTSKGDEVSLLED